LEKGFIPRSAITTKLSTTEGGRSAEGTESRVEVVEGMAKRSAASNVDGRDKVELHVPPKVDFGGAIEIVCRLFHF
jgi:hypothetical protein